MISKGVYKITGILRMIFLAVFALPFLGGYYLLDEDMEKKVIGGILCIVGLAIWFLFGVH